MLRPRRLILVSLSAWICLAVMDAKAEVVSATPAGFNLKISVEISAPAARVYDTIVNSVGSWWNSDHTYSGNARNLTIDPVPGGCFCEKWGSKAGVQHMLVAYADPGKSLRLTGGLGPMQNMGVAGALTFALAEKEGKTTLVLTYIVGGYNPDGLTRWASTADVVLLEQVTRLKRFIETGSAG